MTGYEPDWEGTVKAIMDGGEVRRELLLWNIGRHSSCHPIYLLAYSRSNDPKDLNPTEMSGGQGWESGRTGVKFRRWEWRPMGDKGRHLHSVNGGCPSCFGDEGQHFAGHGLSSEEQHEDRVKRTGSCKDPKVRHFVDVETVRWTEVGRFVKPGFTEERVAAMSEFMARRYAHTAERETGVHHISRDSTEEEVAAFRTKQLEEQRAWFALEDEGRALAAEVWDAALAVEVGKRVGVLF